MAQDLDLGSMMDIAYASASRCPPLPSDTKMASMRAHEDSEAQLKELHEVNQNLQSQLDELNAANAKLQVQVDDAHFAAKEASKESAKANFWTVVSIVISFVSTLIAVASWLFPREVIISWFR